MSQIAVSTLTSRNGTGVIGVPAGNSIVAADVGAFRAPGQILQVRTVRTSATRYSIATQDISAIPELSISFTPVLPNSAVLLTAMINANSQHVATYGFLKGGSPIISNTNTNSSGSILTVYDGQDVTDYMYGQYIEFWDTVTSTSPITYAAAACASWAGTIRTLLINDRAAGDMRSISSMTIYEVAQ